MSMAAEGEAAVRPRMALKEVQRAEEAEELRQDFLVVEGVAQHLGQICRKRFVLLARLNLALEICHLFEAPVEAVEREALVQLQKVEVRVVLVVPAEVEAQQLVEGALS